MNKDDVIKFGGYHPDFSEVIKYYKKNKVYSIQIESNLACKQGCRYCYVSAKTFKSKELPTENVLDVIDSAALMRIKAIDWIGGDPLLRKNWFQLALYANEKGLVNNIWTSGMPLSNLGIARKVVHVTEGGFVAVHLDTLDEAIYQKLHTGNARTKIDMILKGINFLQVLGKKPENMINCVTFTKPIVEDVEETIRYFFEEKGMRTCLTQMCIEGRAFEHLEWIPTIDEIRTAIEARDKINYSNSEISMSAMDVNKFYCGSTICVTANGDVTPCSVIRKGFGNINNKTLKEIVDEHRDKLLFTQLKNPKNLEGACSSCKNNNVCFGCRASAYNKKGRLVSFDPNCHKKNEINPMKVIEFEKY